MIVVDIDLALAQANSRRQAAGMPRLMLKELADGVGIAPENMSRLKNGDFTMIKRSTLEGLCRTLSCQPGDLFRYVAEEEQL